MLKIRIFKFFHIILFMVPFLIRSTSMGPRVANSEQNQQKTLAPEVKKEQVSSSEADAKQEKIVSSMDIAALGDVLGGVSEFDKTPEQIFQRHPLGVYSIKQFTSLDWSKFPDEYKQQGIAPYTDDTAMALLVADVLASLKKENEDAPETFNKTMNSIAHSFLDDSFKNRGWQANFRAPGISTMNAIAQLKRNSLSGNQTTWDQSKTLQENGGCGSVMRAHPCGLRFWNNLELAEKYAVGQSKITHAHPWALAACAAVGVGVALAVQSSSEGKIVDYMIQIAEKYDTSTAQKIKEAYQDALTMRTLVNDIQKPSELIAALKDLKSSISKHHFVVCDKFPGWRADDAVAAAVYAAFTSQKNPFLGIVLGIHSTGDSDSVASIGGALIGALYGKKALAQQVWDEEVTKIERIADIEKVAKQLNKSFLK
jgi:ADP-ribosylglycohydrolase